MKYPTVHLFPRSVGEYFASDDYMIEICKEFIDSMNIITVGINEDATRKLHEYIFSRDLPAPKTKIMHIHTSKITQEFQKPEPYPDARITDIREYVESSSGCMIFMNSSDLYFIIGMLQAFQWNEENVQLVVRKQIPRKCLNCSDIDLADIFRFPKDKVFEYSPQISQMCSVIGNIAGAMAIDAAIKCIKDLDIF